jgi:hypothetical protein
MDRRARTGDTVCVVSWERGFGGLSQDLLKTQKLPQKVSYGKKTLSTIHGYYRLCTVYG